VDIVTMSGWLAKGSLYGIDDRDFDDFVHDNSVLVVKSAGNDGNTSVVTSPGKGLNLLTVGNYDDATMAIYSDPVHGSNGQSPTNTNNRKPELCAPGTNISWPGYSGTGTSLSAPHVAGLLADMLEVRPWMRLNPQLLRAKAILSARDPITGGKPVGEGGFDYLNGIFNGHNFWWQGSASDFAGWESADPWPSNGTLDVAYNFTKGQKVRIVLTWLTRGTYTYAHRNDAHPIGLDLDLLVHDPTGAQIINVSS